MTDDRATTYIAGRRAAAWYRQRINELDELAHKIEADNDAGRIDPMAAAVDAATTRRAIEALENAAHHEAQDGRTLDADGWPVVDWSRA